MNSKVFCSVVLTSLDFFNALVISTQPLQTYLQFKTTAIESNFLAIVCLEVRKNNK